LLKIAACLEEHFPHSIANAVVRAAKEKNLIHDEMHTKVGYVVAHGVKSTIDGAQVLIGSRILISVGYLWSKINSAKWTPFAIVYQCGFAHVIALCISQISGVFNGACQN
jgi:cation transport ATPase